MTTDKPFHHGDLRNALLTTTLEMLKEADGWQFTLRELARRAGVSHTASYKHFPDKASLLAEVAILGFDQLRHVLLDAQPSPQMPKRDGFMQLCHAYVAYGASNPNLYRLMFSAEARERPNAQLKAHGMASMRVLVEAIEQGQRSGWLRSRDASQQAHATWAQLHGLTLLILDGLFGPARGRKRAIQAALDVLFEGLASPAVSCQSA
ncbi:TetR/AcrR family transcriptional regulator [Variovorax saccharolyticus]|uniref:TetR/AcrR family transcriptional regulator n=1 Tax=Variovorax saccharolyticus TaxID=3053516 RepID=UPI00257492B4|nr:TetR/AcrR family transcriptional regulator [Variovorax sp. J31P216]MDM0030101.1 TetR/AcrR family transcriptional regulator [Variovorax sp. J31P216]